MIEERIIGMGHCSECQRFSINKEMKIFCSPECFIQAHTHGGLAEKTEIKSFLTFPENPTE